MSFDLLSRHRSEYVGIPFKTLGRDRSGIDCWGLIKLYYFEYLGIDLPGYEECTKSGRKAISQKVNISRFEDPWTETKSPQDGDVVVCRIEGQPFHVGLYFHHNKMLHAIPKSGVVEVDLEEVEWNNRVLAYYRHQKHQLQ